MNSNRRIHEADSSLEPPKDLSFVLLEGVNESCTDEMIKLYATLLVNPSLDQSVKIEKIRRNLRRCMIQFSKEINLDEIITRQKKVPELAGNTVSICAVRVPNTVRASGLTNSCSKEMLEFYFSNVKVSGGGDIKSIKVYDNIADNKALIEFDDYKKVNDVINRTHIISGVTLKVVKFYGPIEEEYILDEEELSSELDPKMQISRKFQTNIRSFGTSSMSIDRTKIVLSNIQENVSIQHLDFYIQLITASISTEIFEINWSLEMKGKLLIEFKKEVDINKILSEFNNSILNNINGKSIQIETVNKTKTLVVLVKGSKQRALKLNVDNDDYDPESIPATKDLINLYFLNKNRSGGGEIESIERKTSRYWLVVVKDFRVMKDILARKHTVDEKPMKIFPYYDNFGLPYVFKPTFDDHKTQKTMPTSFKLKVKDERLKPFGKVKSFHKKLNELLCEANASSRFNKLDSSILYVNFVEKLVTRVPYSERIWRLRIMDTIEYFFRIYKYEKLTLSMNQWTTISKAKHFNEAFLDSFKIENIGDDKGDSQSLVGSIYQNGEIIKFISNNCAITSINETGTNVEICIVGENNEVNRFIVKIKDVICKAYFTFELEEKIIKFKTYLFECEQLLSKWLNPSFEDSDSDDDRSMTSSRGMNNETGRLKLNKSRRHTIDEFLSKLERDHLDMELSYGNLFQELGYAFLSHSSYDENGEEDDNEYKEFYDSLGLIEEVTVSKSMIEKESQMDKIKFTLDELRGRINEMRKKFRHYSIKAKRIVNNTGGFTSEENDDYEDDEDSDEIFKITVIVKNQERVFTFKIHAQCKIKDLRQILFEKVADPRVTSVDDLIMHFDMKELSNDYLTISDYGIVENCNITLEFDDRQ